MNRNIAEPTTLPEMVKVADFNVQRLRRASDQLNWVGPVDIKTLHAWIGQPTLRNDFWADALSRAGLPSKKRNGTEDHRIKEAA